MKWMSILIPSILPKVESKKSVLVSPTQTWTQPIQKVGKVKKISDLLERAVPFAIWNHREGNINGN